MNSSPTAGDHDEPDMNASSVASLERTGRDLLAAAELLAAGDGKPKTAAALAVPLPALAAALTSLAGATDDLRIDVLWLLRDGEPRLPHGGDEAAVAREARDFSALAGRLYASSRACASLRDHIEPLLRELALADESVAGEDPQDAVGLTADLLRAEELPA